ncbi:hypothetical protein EG244_12290 [Falsigemmobacter faecalis]|uniref:Uncharacterized protein n=1 Tax=Falsigemmobacter faecalis TaxID=2488730 RepID=A0A3P3DJS1_9RHOB|nr:hypothetical protein EG244_12290 [Falsigemmobacter faecalis]
MPCDWMNCLKQPGQRFMAMAFDRQVADVQIRALRSRSRTDGLRRLSPEPRHSTRHADGHPCSIKLSRFHTKADLRNRPGFCAPWRVLVRFVPAFCPNSARDGWMAPTAAPERTPYDPSEGEKICGRRCFRQRARPPAHSCSAGGRPATSR